MESALSHRAIVTGATGYLGSHLVNELLQAGCNVAVIVRPNADIAKLGNCLKSVRVIEAGGDIRTLQSQILAWQPDIVYHLASLYIAEHKPEDVESLIRSNLLFPTQVLEAIRQAGVKRIVNTGTSWQHFHEQEYEAVNLYAATKQAFEMLLDYYVAAYEFEAITLKLHDTYGPGDWRPKLFRTLFSAADSGAVLDMSPGEQQINLVYVDDVIAAFRLAGQKLLRETKSGHLRYDVCSQSPIRLRDLVALVETVYGKSISARWGARPYRTREVMQPRRNGTTLPGWAPSIDLMTGIRQAAAGASKPLPMHRP